MTLGPDQAIACPNCEALEAYMTLTSGNTIGLRVWTDGKQIAPMLPRPPAVVRCHSCGDCYWLQDAKEADTEWWWLVSDRQDSPARIGAPLVQEPTEQEYYAAILNGLAKNAEQERTLRTLAWWRRNDAFRNSAQRDARGTRSSSGEWRSNLQALLSLLDHGEDSQIMKAEVLRELGEFDSAQQVLGRVTSAEYIPVVRQLRSLCEAGDTEVRHLQFRD